MGKCARIIVYRALNVVNGKMYVGVTRVGLPKRKSQHLYAARHGKRNKFCAAIRKYGEDSFVFSVICECADYDEAMAKEIECIAQLRPQYNLTTGGEGNRNLFWTEESKARLSRALKGRKGTFTGRHHTASTKEKLRLQRLGKPNLGRLGKRHSNEVRQKISDRVRANPARYWLGKSRDSDTNLKISQTKTGRPRPTLPDAIMDIFRNNMRRAAKARRRKVKCVDDGMVFECAGAAAHHYGLKPLSINQVCRNPNKRGTLFGKRFRYAE